MPRLTPKKQVTLIQIDVSGAVSTGKSAIAASIRGLLEENGYCVAIPDRAERNNPSKNINSASLSEVPDKDHVVIAITETCI